MSREPKRSPRSGAELVRPANPTGQVEIATFEIAVLSHGVPDSADKACEYDVEKREWWARAFRVRPFWIETDADGHLETGDPYREAGIHLTEAENTVKRWLTPDVQTNPPYGFNPYSVEEQLWCPLAMRWAASRRDHNDWGSRNSNIIREAFGPLIHDVEETTYSGPLPFQPYFPGQRVEAIRRNDRWEVITPPRYFIAFELAENLNIVPSGTTITSDTYDCYAYPLHYGPDISGGEGLAYFGPEEDLDNKVRVYDTTGRFVGRGRNTWGDSNALRGSRGIAEYRVDPVNNYPYGGLEILWMEPPASLIKGTVIDDDASEYGHYYQAPSVEVIQPPGGIIVDQYPGGVELGWSAYNGFELISGYGVSGGAYFLPAGRAYFDHDSGGWRDFGECCGLWKKVAVSTPTGSTYVYYPNNLDSLP